MSAGFSPRFHDSNFFSSDLLGDEHTAIYQRDKQHQMKVRLSDPGTQYSKNVGNQ